MSLEFEAVMLKKSLLLIIELIETRKGVIVYGFCFTED